MLEASFVMTTVKIHIYFPRITKCSFSRLLGAVEHLQRVISNCTNVLCFGKSKELVSKEN